MEILTYPQECCQYSGYSSGQGRKKQGKKRSHTWTKRILELLNDFQEKWPLLLAMKKSLGTFDKILHRAKGESQESHPWEIEVETESSNPKDKDKRIKLWSLKTQGSFSSISHYTSLPFCNTAVLIKSSNWKRTRGAEQGQKTKERKKRGGGLGEGKKHEQEWAGNSKRLKDNCWLENKNLVYKNQSVARRRNNVREGG